MDLTDGVDARLRAAARGGVAFACWAAGAIAVIALIGWGFEIPVLRSPLVTESSMNPLTALSVVFLSVSAWIQSRDRVRSGRQKLALLLAATVVVLAFARLLARSSVGPAIDEALLGLFAPYAHSTSDRMASSTAVCVALIGTGLLCLDRQLGRVVRPAHVFFMTAFAIALIAPIGYGHDVGSIAQTLNYGPMALNAAVAILLLSGAGLFTRVDRGVPRLVLSASPGGVMARQLLPAAVMVPSVLAWWTLRGQPLGVYGPAVGGALMAVVEVGILVLLVWGTARRIDLLAGERDRADARVEEMRTFLDSIVEHLPNMVFVKDATELRFERVNRAAEELLGISRAELLGKNDYDFFPTEQADFFTGKDREVLDSCELLDIPEEVISTAGRGVRYLHTKKVPICDDQQRPRYLLGISEDITERRGNERKIAVLHGEIQRRVDELQFANQELEAFCYSVSHDLRAPLRHINGYADLLVHEHLDQLDESARARLMTIVASAQRMNLLIDDLLAFSRMGRAEVKQGRVELEAVVRDALSELRPELEGRDVRIDVGPLPGIEGDPSMLRVAFVNLLSNAAKYTGTREHAVISIRTVEHAACGPDEVVLCVRDNGVGFDMKYVGKLFGVFQRLHGQEFPGTGIGLATVSRIIHKHGGRVWADAVPGEGASFYLCLPSPESMREESSICAA